MASHPHPQIWLILLSTTLFHPQIPIAYRMKDKHSSISSYKYSTISSNQNTQFSQLHTLIIHIIRTHIHIYNLKMMKRGGVASFVGLAVVMVVVLAAEVHKTAAADCDPLALSPCLPAITGSGNPTAECCNNLKEQVPCFCQYLKNPAFAPYINSPNAKKVVTACGVQPPTC